MPSDHAHASNTTGCDVRWLYGVEEIITGHLRRLSVAPQGHAGVAQQGHQPQAL